MNPNPSPESVSSKDFAFALVCHSYPKALSVRTPPPLALPWREAGPPNHHDDKAVSDQQGYLKRIETLEPVRISRKEYFNFASMLNAIDDIQVLFSI